MSASYSITGTETFTLTHAKRLASKVATDLKRMQRFYDRPLESSIEKYEAEVVALAKAGYLEKVSYGFQRNGNWIEPSVHYRASDILSSTGLDDDPGGIAPGADVQGASFYSFLTYSSAWSSLSASERDAFESDLPFRRSDGTEPGIQGYLEHDRTYSAGGKSLTRSSVRSIR
jgi:hypothetical protein